jgi:hypothetical protein
LKDNNKVALFQNQAKMVMKCDSLYPEKRFPVMLEGATENGMRLKLYNKLSIPAQTPIQLFFTDKKFQYEFPVTSVTPVQEDQDILIVTKPEKVKKQYKRVFVRLETNLPGYYEKWDGSGDRHDVWVIDISGGGCSFITDNEVIIRDLLRFGCRLTDDLRLANICGKVVRVNPIGDDYPLPDIFLGIEDRSEIFEVGLQFTIIPTATVNKIVDYVNDRLSLR